MITRKPTPRQEFTGRVAVVVMALVFGGIATVLVRIAARAVVIPLLLLAAFLYLLAGTTFCFAFLRARDTRRGPPRGFATVSAIFDAFWKVVGWCFRRRY